MDDLPTSYNKVVPSGSPQEIQPTESTGNSVDMSSSGQSDSIAKPMSNDSSSHNNVSGEAIPADFEPLHNAPLLTVEEAFSADFAVQDFAATTIFFTKASQLNQMTIQHKVLFIIVKIFEKWHLPWSKENFRHIQKSAGFFKIVSWAMDNSPSEIAGTGENWTRIDQDLLSPPTGRLDEFIVERLRKAYEQFDNFDELFAQALADLEDRDDEADLPGEEGPDGEPRDCNSSVPECEHTADVESTEEELARAQEVDKTEKEASVNMERENAERENVEKEKEMKEKEKEMKEKEKEMKEKEKEMKEKEKEMKEKEKEMKEKEKEKNDRGEEGKEKETKKKEEKEKETKEKEDSAMEGEDSSHSDKTDGDRAYSQEQGREAPSAAEAYEGELHVDEGAKRTSIGFDTSGATATSATPAATSMSSAPSPATNATSTTSPFPLEGSLKIILLAPSHPRRALSTIQTQVGQSPSLSPQDQRPKTTQKGKKRSGSHHGDTGQVRKLPRTEPDDLGPQPGGSMTDGGPVSTDDKKIRKSDIARFGCRLGCNRSFTSIQSRDAHHVQDHGRT